MVYADEPYHDGHGPSRQLPAAILTLAEDAMDEAFAVLAPVALRPGLLVREALAR